MVLHYQPLVAVADQRIIGVEALLRWRDPIEGLMMPNRFIPLAEETGLIVPLGDWVLREACRRLQAWREAGVAIDSIAVNLSPRQFQQVEILDQVRDVLTETGLPSHCLELEITESALMHPGAATLEKLAALKALGVRLAVDDFGTGYSSLSYLKRFPLDRLKIDRSFIADIPGNAADMEISGAIIGIAKNLHLEVLAEGVETAAQLEFLKQHGCDSAQGYLFARPLPEADLLRMLADRAAQARPFPLSATGS
jgi:EAL domain-containing protein (putative c-di-GMP-specific phosphodiesterase class I)